MLIMMLGEFFIYHIDDNLVELRVCVVFFAPHAVFSIFLHDRISDQKRLFYKDLRSALIELKSLKINNALYQTTMGKAKIYLKT